MQVYQGLSGEKIRLTNIYGSQDKQQYNYQENTSENGYLDKNAQSIIFGTDARCHDGITNSGQEIKSIESNIEIVKISTKSRIELEQEIEGE